MKILLANNYFYLRGGCERIFFDEAYVLTNMGHDISYFATHDERNLPTPFSHYFVSKLQYKITDTFRFIYCRESKRQIERLLRRYRPDIAHLHNIYQDISPSILHVLKRYGIPVVLTLHDHKMICPNYIMMHGSEVCEDCSGGRFYKCVVNRCKQGSYLYSLVPTLEAYVHNLLDIWKKNVDCFISPSNYLKNKLVESGWDPARISYIPNFIDIKPGQPSDIGGDYLLYLGRLSQEKGVGTLLQAYNRSGQDRKALTIAGDGPMREQLEEMAEKGAGSIRFTGHLSGQALWDVIADSLAVIMPSECYENAPLSLLEAFAYGKPVIGARIGGIPEIIDDGVNGLLFESGNVEDLKEKIEMISGLPGTKISEMGKAAREKAEQEYNAGIHYEKLMEVYLKALNKE